jgi:hypothetical protein
LNNPQLHRLCTISLCYSTSTFTMSDPNRNNDYYLDSNTEERGDTLSAGSTARNQSAVNPNGNNINGNALEKDFSNTNGGRTTSRLFLD